MIERRREINAKDNKFSKGDVVLVLRDVGSPELEGKEEEGGIVFRVEDGGRMFINYGGIVSLLHDDDQIRLAPPEIKDALELRLKQNDEELTERMTKATKNLSKVLEECRDNDTFLKWLKNSIKSKFNL